MSNYSKKLDKTLIGMAWNIEMLAYAIAVMIVAVVSLFVMGVYSVPIGFLSLIEYIQIKLRKVNNANS